MIALSKKTGEATIVGKNWYAKCQTCKYESQHFLTYQQAGFSANKHCMKNHPVDILKDDSEGEKQ